MAVLQDACLFHVAPGGEIRLRMMQKKNFPSAMFCFLAVALVHAPFVAAQLSTSLSSSLDTDLNGLDSSVAPIPSSEIEPGANNLAAPEDRQLPYDALGASVVATTMDPTVNQYSTITRTAYQLDSTVRDVTQLTGLHQHLPTSIIDVIAAKGESIGTSTQFRIDSSLASVRSGAPGISLASSFGIKKNIVSPPAASANSLNLSRQTETPAGSAAVSTPYALPSAMPLNGSATESGDKSKDSTSQADSTLQAHKRSDTRRGNGSGSASPRSEEQSQDQNQNQDYSRSPLERIDISSTELVQEADNPFRDLGETSFLKPDITLTSSSRQPKSKPAYKTPSHNDNASARLKSPTRETHLSSAEARLLKRQEPGMSRPKKPKWRNPILQQMEEVSNP